MHRGAKEEYCVRCRVVGLLCCMIFHRCLRVVKCQRALVFVGAPSVYEPRFALL